MNESATRFTQRYARYTLNPLDDSFIRFAGPHQAPWEEDTEIKDISLTGLCFTTPSILAPKIGEIIKIQFRTPEDQEMASFALVTRIELVTAEKFLVAVKFYKMNMDQRVQLASGLAKKIKQQVEKNRALSWSAVGRFMVQNFRKLLMWVPLLMLFAWIYALTKPLSVTLFK